MAEFPELGRHCYISSCNKLDFAPFTCTLCGRDFCVDHRSRHRCNDEGGTGSEDAGASVAHNDGPRYLCSMSGCFNKELVKFICSLCRLNYCKLHRQCEEHSCVELPPRDAKERCESTRAEEVPVAARPEQRKLNPAQLSRVAKVHMMKLKASPSACAAGIPSADRMFVYVLYEDGTREECIQKRPVVISRQWTVGKMADALVKQLSGVNRTALGARLSLLVGDEETPLTFDEPVNGKMSDECCVRLVIGD